MRRRRESPQRREVREGFFIFFFAFLASSRFNPGWVGGAHACRHHHQRWRVLLLALPRQHLHQGRQAAREALERRGLPRGPRRLQTLGPHYFRAKGRPRGGRPSPATASATTWPPGTTSSSRPSATTISRFDHPVEGGDTFVPCLGRVKRYNQPWLVICEAPFCLPDSALKDGHPSEDALAMEPRRATRRPRARVVAGAWSRCLSRLFAEEDAPRWVLLSPAHRSCLSTATPSPRAATSPSTSTTPSAAASGPPSTTLAAFLSAETLCPEGESDTVLHDTIEEQSHRFAHGVTEALQFAVREAIELLVNEWADDRRERKLSLFKRQPAEVSSGRG